MLLVVNSGRFINTLKFDFIHAGAAAETILLTLENKSSIVLISLMNRANCSSFKRQENLCFNNSNENFVVF